MTIFRFKTGSRPRRKRRIVSIVVCGALVAVLVGAAPAVASGSQSATLDFVLVRADQGDAVELASFPVDADLVGRTCEMSASVVNQRSVNLGNDVTVSTGSDSIVLADVEAVAGVVSSTSGPIEVGDSVTFTLRMGPARVFSGGLALTLTCDEPAPPETTSTTAPPTTVTPVVASSSTTTTSTTTVPAGDIAPSPAPTPVPAQPVFTG